MSALLRFALRLLFRVRVRSPSSAASAGPALYVARHRSVLDNLLLPLFLPGRPLVVFPREDLRSRWLRLILRRLPHAVLDVNDPATIKKTLRLLAGRRSLVLYPEGRVVPSTGVMKNYEVAALIAVRSSVPVIPVVVMYGAGRVPSARIHLGSASRMTGANEANRSARARRANSTRRLQQLLEAATVDARPRQGLFDAFLDAVEREGRRTAIIEDMKEEPRTYGELLKGALALRRWSARLGEPGENLGVLLPNVIPTACALLGIIASGRVPAVLNYSSGPSALQSACAAARVRTVITSRGFIEQARLAHLLASIRHLTIVYLEDARAQLGLYDKLWLLLYAVPFPRAAVARADPHAPAVVLFTSGSEARPKGVVLSHDAVLANIHQIGAVIDFTAQDKVLNALPLYHSYGFTAGLMLCLVTGVKLFLYISPLRYRAIPEIAYRRDVTYLFGTSTFLTYYARRAHPLDFHKVRYVISGGEKLGDEVAALYLEKFGLRIFEGYGATECAPVIALSTPQCHRVGTVGRPLPSMQTRLEPLSGIEHGALLHVAGPNVMLGYYRYDNPGVIDPPRSAFGDGWYCTGDVVDVGQDGVLQVVGRVRRFAKIAGEMVSMDAIEEIAQRASPQHGHAVVLRMEQAGGETTVLFTTDPALTRHALARCARELGRQDLAVARQVVWLPELPLLGSGKTDYVTLQCIDLTGTAANEPMLKAAEPGRPYA
jgi:acyl-[acyl-carrier-protein]-phospholipid O-acyltransferase / long-chain-fatty-acid--[acyl-carrier-protein] ligase